MLFTITQALYIAKQVESISKDKFLNVTFDKDLYILVIYLIS